MENKTTQPQPQVQKALAQLDATIDKLTELVKIQEERLASILKEQPQKVENTCEVNYYLKRDFNGNLRDSQWDIGAYEYVP